jgi:hypothetical protein
VLREGLRCASDARLAGLKSGSPAPQSGVGGRRGSAKDFGLMGELLGYIRAVNEISAQVQGLSKRIRYFKTRKPGLGLAPARGSIMVRCILEVPL